MSPLPLSTLAAWAGGTLRGAGTTEAQRLWTDSRTIRPGDLFVALRGERFDGHAFLEAAARRGAVGAVAEPARLPPGLPSDFFRIEVADVGRAYQRMAAAWRQRLASLRVVAVTGSNGKTSTKDFTAAVLRERFRTRATEGNLNNHVGLPRTVLGCESDDEAAVWEIGMNHFGEIQPLAEIAAPEIAIITNVGMAHIEFLGTRAGIAWEKGALLGHVRPEGLVILPAHDDFAASLAARSLVPVMTAGIGAGTLQATSVVPEGGGIRFRIAAAGEKGPEVHLPVPGRHMVVNALLAAAAGRHFGLSLEECAAGLSRAVLTGGRLERKRVGRWDFLDDSYNANPDSVVAALATLRETPVAGRRFAVLGRMGELGSASVAGHRRVGAAAAASGLDGLCVVGSEAAEIAKSAASHGLETALVENREAAAEWLRQSVGPSDLILLKGSRSAGLDHLLSLLDGDSQERT